MENSLLPSDNAASACRKPCKSCPFRRDSVAGPEGEGYGHFDTGEMVGQVYGPFWLPCHQSYAKWAASKQDVMDKVSELPQCAGAAIFRANIGRSQFMPDNLLQLPADKETVFANYPEFIAFHTGVKLESIQVLWNPDNARKLMVVEMNKSEAKHIPKTNL